MQVSLNETDGIEAPAITVFAVKGMSLGWKTVGKNVTNMGTFKMFDLCMKAGFTDVATCVSNDTFGLSEFLKLTV